MLKRLFYLQMMLLVAACGAITPVVLAQDDASCVRGKPSAPVHIEVFSDYECPACRAFYLQTMKLVFANYADKGKVCVVYRDFPSFSHSREAARLVRAALRLGVSQWGLVSDALFESQPEWSQSGNLQAVVASALGASDMAAVQKHLKDPLLEAVIDNDAILGLKRQVNSTPTFFITARGKTEKVEAALTYAAMQRRLDELLEETIAAMPSPPGGCAGGISRASVKYDWVDPSKSQLLNRALADPSAQLDVGPTEVAIGRRTPKGKQLMELQASDGSLPAYARLTWFVIG